MSTRQLRQLGLLRPVFSVFGRGLRLIGGAVRLVVRGIKLSVAFLVALVLNILFARSGELFVLDLRHGLHAEQPGLVQLVSKRRALSLYELLRSAEIASADPAMQKVLVLLDFFDESPANVDAIVRVIEQLRASGRTVWTWAASYSRSSYLVASAADRVYMAPGGSLELRGIALGAVFIKDLLDTVGVEAELEHIGDYKSMSETFTRNSISGPHKEMLEDLTDGLYRRILSTFSRNRKLSYAAAEACFDHGPFLASQATAARLIDGLRYYDELEELFEQELGTKPTRVGALEYLRAQTAAEWFGRVRKPPPLLAFVPLEGSILDTDPGRGEAIVPEHVARLLERLGNDKRVRGAVLWINSPGGSAAASDLLWRAVKQLDKHKPVVISLGPIAASGGYYLAAAGRRIFAEPGSLTGSIGVVAGKVNGSRLLGELGVYREEVERGRFAGMSSPWRAFSEAERGKLRESMEACYELFLQRVAEGRRMSRDEVHSIAQGRVWTGTRAHQIGLVDSLGGPAEALATLAKLCDFPADGTTEVFTAQPRRLPFPASMLLGERARGLAETVRARLLGRPGRAQDAWLQALTSFVAERPKPWALMPFWTEVSGC